MTTKIMIIFETINHLFIDYFLLYFPRYNFMCLHEILMFRKTVLNMELVFFYILMNFILFINF